MKYQWKLTDSTPKEKHAHNLTQGWKGKKCPKVTVQSVQMQSTQLKACWECQVRTINLGLQITTDSVGRQLLISFIGQAKEHPAIVLSECRKFHSAMLSHGTTHKPLRSAVPSGCGRRAIFFFIPTMDVYFWVKRCLRCCYEAQCFSQSFSPRSETFLGTIYTFIQVFLRYNESVVHFAYNIKPL